MTAQVRAVPPAEFEAWYAAQKAAIVAADSRPPPAQRADALRTPSQAPVARAPSEQDPETPMATTQTAPAPTQRRSRRSPRARSSASRRGWTVVAHDDRSQAASGSCTWSRRSPSS